MPKELKKDLTFKEAFTRLEEIAKILEESEVDLEEAIELVREAKELEKFCKEKLNQFELKISKIFIDKAQ